MNSRERYDAIYLDLPYASDYGLSRLYSREFYFFIRRLLNPGGFAAQDANGIEALSYPDDHGGQHANAGNLWDSYYATITAAGFKGIAPFLINLEVDNPEATALLTKNLESESEAPPAAKARAVRHFLTNNAYLMQMGFILMAAEDLPKMPQPAVIPVAVDALTPRRVELAFRTPLAPLDDFHGGTHEFNSIIRPTIPRGSFWGVKIPQLKF
jgi:hypothetical protein